MKKYVHCGVIYNSKIAGQSLNVLLKRSGYKYTVWLY